MEYFIVYLVVGLAINILTMISNEYRSYWFEFGCVGLVIQLLASTLFFPVVLYCIIQVELEDLFK